MGSLYGPRQRPAHSTRTRQVQWVGEGVLPPEEQYEDILQFTMFDNLQTDDVPAPACIQQAPFASIPPGAPGSPSQYQKVVREP